MEKETLIQNLKTKVGENDFNVLSSRTVDSIVEPLLPMFADDSKITDESYTLPVSVLKSYIGQYRHDLAEGIKTGKTTWETAQKEAQQKAIEEAVKAAKAEWEKNHQTSTTTQTQTQTQQTQATDADIDKKIADAIAAAIGGLTSQDGVIGKLSGSMTEFMDSFKKQQREETLSRVKDSLRSYLLEERGADREAVVNLAIKELKIDENPDVDRLKVEVEKKYEQLYKDFYGDMNGSPYAGGAGGAQDNNKAFENYMKKHEEQIATNAKNAEALGKLLM